MVPARAQWLKLTSPREWFELGNVKALLKLLPGLFMTPAATSLAATPPHAHALQDMSAREIAARIAARELSSAEVVEHFIARLKAVNGKLNAVTADLSESARQAAADVDSALARGEKLGPLAGLPVTIKECFDLAGTASTFGLTSRRDEIESKDDPYVAALRAAGAIPIAKTNLPQLMIFTETDNPLYGRTNNPWDLERSCGGSSGGEAAVIAAGASPLGLGNDIGGSLRIPAAFCGITSIRPTAGRTPDHCAHGLPVGQTGIVSQVGPMARHVEDLVVGLRVLDRRARSVCRSRTGIGRSGRRRHQPVAICHLHR